MTTTVLYRLNDKIYVCYIFGNDIFWNNIRQSHKFQFPVTLRQQKLKKLLIVNVCFKMILYFMNWRHYASTLCSLQVTQDTRAFLRELSLLSEYLCTINLPYFNILILPKHQPYSVNYTYVIIPYFTQTSAIFYKLYLCYKLLFLRHYFWTQTLFII